MNLPSDAALVALGLYYDDLATELRMEMVRTAENNPQATREDFIADIGRRFTVMTESAAPELQVRTINEGDDYVRQVLVCPHCHSIDVEVKEVDTAERWNTAEPEIDGDTLVLNYAMGDSQFDHDHYECASCDRRVSLPATLTPHESWD